MTNIMWRQGEVIELEISDLSDTGDGVGRFDQRVVFVPDTVVGDRALVKLLHVKPKYAHGQVQDLLTASPQRRRPSCIVADKCGGCQWQHINYDYQLIAKQNQVKQALERIGGFINPQINPVLVAASPLDYRNKVTYPLGMSATGQVQAGYYHKGSHKLINLNQCPVQDQRLNILLTEIKLDIQQQGWSIYDETQHKGLIRHLGLRIGRRTGEILLTLVVKDWNLPGIENQAQQWLQRYPQLVGISLNRNSDRTNAIFGSQTRCLAGVPYLRETFANLEFQICPDTFFQVSTETAEALLDIIKAELNLQGHEVLLDAYCGIGTLTLPLAKQVRHITGLELQSTAVEQAIINAQNNGINNVTFQVGAVEKILPNLDIIPDIVLLDPPRKGCEINVIKTLRKLKPFQIVYVSCKVSTLARDLKLLCEDGLYKLTKVQPADFFPQTAHVEAAAFLTLSENDKSN
ncbi:23S rRNA (uracil(1939)-C(5))-methyltransferase RlmD [Cuspidothrix issatschenkoi LEGE 03284]|uniref:23S rRNA (uracil(1939)-C(5))-methyltransferase RlmD n=1 Tax=Cuspidothrix issatschenkoi TaxID=230752 RepID=UPI0018810925|nr:23S rRNA (uracil(1939)-C(5))-methyltransferase RlmD [Cuspidothrix issatschenkoi]MBE9234079.1 23S rRNA (uracil(1939)-C(5))-methyltransferase RlmD [Cuspidothrix issatschenkoi LEGE 03284]